MPRYSINALPIFGAIAPIPELKESPMAATTSISPGFNLWTLFGFVSDFFKSLQGKVPSRTHCFRSGKHYKLVTQSTIYILYTGILTGKLRLRSFYYHKWKKTANKISSQKRNKRFCSSFSTTCSCRKKMLNLPGSDEKVRRTKKNRIKYLTISKWILILEI